MFKIISLLSLLILNILAQEVLSKVLPCIEFKNRLCIRCPQKTHFQSQQCYQNISKCIEYQYGTASSTCKKYQNQTNSLNSSSNSFTIKNQSYFYANITIQSYVSKLIPNKNDQTFKQMTSVQYQKDNFFQFCNNYMIKGQYSHFISRTIKPIQSVFSYLSNQGFKQFKILYQGSGGNLLLCLIGININNKSIILRSFVTIGRTQMIEDCIDYSTRMECQKCSEGYHLDYTTLEQKICIINIPGCLQYYGNICIKCRGHSHLVENRCVSDCTIHLDSRSIRFYSNMDLSVKNFQANPPCRNYYLDV